jgi:hypothetical protein
MEERQPDNYEIAAAMGFAVFTGFVVGLVIGLVI